MESENSILSQAIKTGLIDKNIESSINLQPKIITNNFQNNEKVLSVINDLLVDCEEFFFNVAFLTKSGVLSLINTLERIEKSGINGKVLISKYQNFSDPNALRMLLNFSNIELRVIDENNFHAKGYLFKLKNNYELIIGSSNLTQDALSKNTEYNLKLSLSKNSKLKSEALSLFTSYFSRGIKVSESFLNEYEQVYGEIKRVNQSVSTKKIDKFSPIEPNVMQKEALINLENLRRANVKKALLISATATGKTYLSAFDAKNFNAKRVLFIVHRWNIAKKAMESFEKIFGDERTYGLYKGSINDINFDFIFSTNLTISNSQNLNKFSPDFFDYIIIDETHRAGASTYQKIINYFSPKFLLGMTASPERTDGFDIFKLFDHNIAYEIRLQKAMEEELVVPFHYFGITDLNINGEIIDEKSDFNKLICDERVERILDISDKYGCDDNIIRGIVFCSRKDEAYELANKFNLKGRKSITLTGSQSEDERENAIQQLESDNLEEKLEFIFAVDIFNEGIDIPRINQIIMLRPTQSNIIFIQQLGRGLRRFEKKEYLTVIDFIGNYQNNFLIPVALFGDTSYNKDNLRKLLSAGSAHIPGASTVNFDEISKKKIFESISNANLQTKRELINDYRLMKYKLGRYPMMMDFFNNNARDPIQFVNHSNSYIEFLNMVEDDFQIDLNYKNLKLLQISSQFLNNGKSILDVYLIKILCIEERISTEDFKSRIEEKFKIIVENQHLKSVFNIINFKYFTELKESKKVPVGEIYNFEILKIRENIITIGSSLKEAISSNNFKLFLLDSLNYAIKSFGLKKQKTDYKEGFLRYEKYTRRDIHRILNWPKEPNHQSVGGYMSSPDKQNCPIFVKYKKDEKIADTMKYEDKFINNFTLEWYSKNSRTFKSGDVIEIIESSQNNMRLPLFLKKDDNEGLDFYFLGDLKVDKSFLEETFIIDKKNDKKKAIVKMRMHLDKPIKEDLYRYIID